MFKKILLASDGSDGALKAAKAAAELANKFGASLTVLHVYSLPVSLTTYTGLGGSEICAEEIARCTNDVQEAVEERTATPLNKANIPFEFRHEIGHPAETIIQVASSEHFDLVVLGSRGLSEIGSFLLGSVSDKVSHHAHCPVLLVK
jgi:nucleotide-binding universal stress UspA family protein